MPRVSLDQVASLPDVLDQTGFNIYFGAIPLANGGSQTLTLSCVNVTLPGQGNESFEAPLHGQVFKFRGRKTTARTLNITFYELSDGGNLQTLLAWNEYCVGTKSGNSGGYKSQYATDMRVDILDTVGNAVRSHLVHGVFPQDIPDVQMDGTSSAPVQLSPVFNYDWIDWNNGALL